MKAEAIPYSRDGDRGLTQCPHGGSWWSRSSFMQINKVGKRVPAKVGTNACANCIFHKGTEWDHVKCVFLKADQRFVKRQLERRCEVTDVAVILLVIYAMVGIGYAIGLVDEEDSHGIQAFKFIISFLLWPVLMGFKAGDDKW